MKLFIAEKPSVARAISKELGVVKAGKSFTNCKNDVCVTWCFGHLLEQVGPDYYLYGKDDAKAAWTMDVLPVVPDRWHLEVKKDVKAQFNTIAKLLKKADTVINAGDPDREGQLLVDEILGICGYKGRTLRFWTSAQDPASIRKGLSSLKPNEKFIGMRLAALGRSRADWLLGMNLTRAYTLSYKKRNPHLEKGEGLIAVGRVQTPTLAMVAKRDSDIASFRPIDYFTFKANLKAQERSFLAVWKPSDKQEGLDQDKRLIDRAAASKLQAKFKTATDAKLISFEQTAKSQNQPKAFSLAEIQLVASNKFGFSAEETLKTCQSLYEKHKLTSYPRTDCAFLPESQWSDASSILSAIAQTCPDLASLVKTTNTSIKSPTWNDKKITAHHGIIPTSMSVNFKELSPTEQSIYRLIAQRYIAQFLPPFKYMASEAVLDISGEKFVATGKVVIQPGWKTVYAGKDESSSESEDSDKEESEQAFPDLRSSQITVNSIVCKPEKTKAPSAFTEGTLVQAMENIHLFVTDEESKKWLKEGDGIGTPATRASIISELKNKKYLEVKGKKIHATARGLNVLKNVSSRMRSPVITAIFERQLKDVELGQAKLSDFLQRQIDFIRKEVDQCKSSK